jgi:hypothetical protein
VKTFILLACAAIASLAAGPIREEQTIEVQGVREVWRLEWKSPPKPECVDAGDWYNCPCNGFAFGETGVLDLVRLRQGREVDRLPLNPLFKAFDQPGHLIVPRFPVGEKDMDNWDVPDLQAIVARRPPVKLMQFADYDHDGAATEFYLQTESGPCGHRWGPVVGLSKSNPRLHAFGSALHPDNPLSLEKREWDALLRTRGPVHLEDWLCGDHGKGRQTELQLQATPRGIEVIREDYACPRIENARPLKRQTQ